MKSVGCPTCKRAVVKGTPGLEKVYPFCCERCYMADLGRWLNEDYRIPDETTRVPVEQGDDDGR